MGTPQNYSPEVVRKEKYGFKSDVWSLGVVLYQLTNLELPFVPEGTSNGVQKCTRGNLLRVRNQ